MREFRRRGAGAVVRDKLEQRPINSAAAQTRSRKHQVIIQDFIKSGTWLYEGIGFKKIDEKITNSILAGIDAADAAARAKEQKDSKYQVMLDRKEDEIEQLREELEKMRRGLRGGGTGLRGGGAVQGFI